MTPTRARRLSLQPESGFALFTTMMVMMLVSVLAVGFTTMVSSNSRIATLNLGRTSAFYAAHAGLEKLTAELGDTFAVNFAPSGDEIRLLENMPPSLMEIRPDGGFPQGFGPRRGPQFPQRFLLGSDQAHDQSDPTIGRSVSGTRHEA